MSAHSYITVIAQIATYVAALPGPLQAKLLRLFLDDPSPPQHGTMTKLAFLGSAVVMLLAIVNSLGRRRNRRPLVNVVPTEVVSAELKNVSHANKAYVHLFVRNILLVAMNNELKARLDNEVKETNTLKRRLSGMSGVRRLQKRVEELSEKERHMKTVFAKLRNEFASMPDEIVVLDWELKELRVQNEDYLRQIEELQEKSLRNTRNLTRSRTNAYVKQQQVEHLRNKVTNILRRHG